MDKIVFKNCVVWFDGESSKENNEPTVREWMVKRFVHEVITPSTVDMRKVGEITHEEWSAYTEQFEDISHYFFKSGVDAMAFKLKFL